MDRDYTISDFKKGLRPLMVATSVAGITLCKTNNLIKYDGNIN